MLRRRMLVTLEISNRDPGYGWFLNWMEQARKANSTGLVGRWSRSADLSLSTNIHRAKEHAAPQVGFSFLAGVGRHFLRYRGAWMQVRACFLVRGQWLT